MKRREVLPIVLLGLVLVLGCEQRSHEGAPDTNYQADAQEVNISVAEDQRIFIDGNEIVLEDLGRTIFEMLGGQKADYVITVAPETPMGLISDLQQQLPAATIASISYPEPGR